MTSTEASALLRFARAAARRTCHRIGLPELADDAAQHALLTVLEHPEHGHGPLRLRQAALDYCRRWLGQRWTVDQHGGRHRRIRPAHVELPENLSDEVVDAPSRAIALWRLQRAWPTLTAIQQEALLRVLSGDDGRADSWETRRSGTGREPLEIARRRGAARANALQRIDHMHEFTRVATRRAS